MRNRASKDYRKSQIDYLAPASERIGDSEGYSRRISSDGYSSQRRKKRKRRKILVAIAVVVVALVVGGGAAALGYIGFLNDEIHSGIDDMGALQDALASNREADDPFYVLLLGSDFRDDGTAEGDRSDSIILARIDERQKQVVLVSIPRDTRVNIEGVGEAKINAAYAYGGAAGAVEAVEEFAGIEISHFAQIDFSGFVDLVDALGGVEVDVPMEIDDADAGGYVAAGLQTLDGEHALIFCRSRATAIGDYQRQANQRVFLQALASKVLASDPMTMFSAITTIASCVSTDMDVDAIYSIANNLSGMSSADIYTYSVPSEAQTIGGVSYVIADDEAWAEMMDTIDSGGLPDEQSWYISGIVADEYNSVANATGSSDTSASASLDRAAYGLVVRNGGGVEGSATEAADKLAESGYIIYETGNAQQFVYDETLVIYNDETQMTAVNDIISQLGVGTAVENAGRYDFDGSILVMVGADYSADESES